MKIKNLLSLLVICTLVGACNKKSDSDGKILTDEELLAKGTNIDIESHLQSGKIDLILSANEYVEQKKLYSEYYMQNSGIGCSKDADGKLLDQYDKNPKVIDKDLKVGDAFNIQYISSRINEAYENSSTSTVTKILDMQIVYNYIIDKSINIWDGSFLDTNSIFISKPHGTRTFDNLNENGTTVLNFSQKGLELLESLKNKNGDNSYWSCWVFESKTDKNSVALINYEMNGKKIPALLTEYSSSGKVKCEKRSNSTDSEEGKVLKTVVLENGESSSKRISSRMVKSNYLVQCEGEELFRQSVTKADGKVISASAEKTTAPLR